MPYIYSNAKRATTGVYSVTQSPVLIHPTVPILHSMSLLESFLCRFELAAANVL